MLMLMPGKGMAQNVNIPYAAFKAALLGNSIINTINDGQISVAEAAENSKHQRLFEYYRQRMR